MPQSNKERANPLEFWDKSVYSSLDMDLRLDIYLLLIFATIATVFVQVRAIKDNVVQSKKPDVDNNWAATAGSSRQCVAREEFQGRLFVPSARRPHPELNEEEKTERRTDYRTSAQLGRPTVHAPYVRKNKLNVQFDYQPDVRRLHRRWSMGKRFLTKLDL